MHRVVVVEFPPTLSSYLSLSVVSLQSLLYSPHIQCFSRWIGVRDPLLFTTFHDRLAPLSYLLLINATQWSEAASRHCVRGGVMTSGRSPEPLLNVNGTWGMILNANRAAVGSIWWRGIRGGHLKRATPVPAG